MTEVVTVRRSSVIATAVPVDRLTYVRPGSITAATVALTGPQGQSGTTELAMSIPGTLSTGVGVIPFPATRDLTAGVVLASVGIAPTGADLVFDVKVNGVSMFLPGNLPTILAGSTVSTVVSPDLPEISLGDLITVDVVQVGSGQPGAEAVVVLSLT